MTLTPWKVGEGDVAHFCEVEFDEAAILDICQVVCYYNYVNRLAGGLGVELGADWGEEDYPLTWPEFEEQRSRSE